MKTKHGWKYCPDGKCEFHTIQEEFDDGETFEMTCCKHCTVYKWVWDQYQEFLLTKPKDHDRFIVDGFKGMDIPIEMQGECIDSSNLQKYIEMILMRLN